MTDDERLEANFIETKETSISNVESHLASNCCLKPDDVSHSV